MKIRFEKANLNHLNTIFDWLSEPHMIEFWDNSQEHKDDILNFVHGRKQHYFYGTTQYWVGFENDEPFCFILSDVCELGADLPDVYRKNMSASGTSVGIDFGIGNKKYVGKGLAVITLDAFIHFYQKSVDTLANTFFIDPDMNNPRAKRVYGKAGFKEVGMYEPDKGAFVGGMSCLMVRNK